MSACAGRRPPLWKIPLHGAGIGPETQSFQDAKHREVPPNASSVKKKHPPTITLPQALSETKYPMPSNSLVWAQKLCRARVNLTKMQLSAQTGCGSILPRQVRKPGTELDRVEPQLRQKFGDKHSITPTGWKHFDRWALHQKFQFLSKSKHLKGMCYFLRHFSASAKIFSTLFFFFLFLHFKSNKMLCLDTAKIFFLFSSAGFMTFFVTPHSKMWIYCSW